MKTAYLDTGTWAEDKGRSFWKLLLVASSKEQNYNHIPKDILYLLMLIIFIARATILFFGTQMKEQRYANCLNEFGYFFRVFDFSNLI
jgi:phosphoserine aminotransferase